MTHRPIEIVSLSDEALSDTLKGAGCLNPSRALTSVDANVRAGYADMATNAIETLSRRKPCR